MTDEQLNLLNGVLKKLVELERRIASLEQYKDSSTYTVRDLSYSKCIHCGRLYDVHDGFAYACGAMPKCSHCNHYQYSAWDYPSDAIPSGTLEARNRHPIPWLYDYKCIKCGEAFRGSGPIVCGAMPMCPNCGSYQGGAWDSLGPNCSGKHPVAIDSWGGRS